MGCCGHDFISGAKIKEAIRRNTREFELLNPVSEQEFLNFMNRKNRSDLLNGVCRNLIEKKGRIFCPLHPSLHGGKDLREGHCDINHLCKTAQEFAGWDEEKKKKFTDFVHDKKLDNISYSIKMDDNSLLKEFKSYQ